MVFFFFFLLNWENQTWYLEQGWLFSIGNWAKIRPLVMGRKSPSYFNGVQYNYLLLQDKFPDKAKLLPSDVGKKAECYQRCFEVSEYLF